jgi:hypothetical protein
MQAIFERTQKSVDALLQPLSGNAVARWENGIAQLSTEFEASLADVKKKIEDRHSGVLGGLTELGDDMFGLPSWVTMGGRPVRGFSGGTDNRRPEPRQHRHYPGCSVRRFTSRRQPMARDRGRRRPR